MARYRKISVCIWNDAKFNRLPDDAKLVFIFVLTHPHMTSLGAMRATIPGLACELGWLPERLREAFRKASGEGIAKHDEKASCVFLPNFIKHNPPESPNVVAAWIKCLDDIPDCDLKGQAIHAAIRHAEGMSEGFAKPLGSLREALAKSMPKSMPNQEQEQEQDKEEPSLRSGSCPEVVEPPAGLEPVELPKLVGTLPLTGKDPYGKPKVFEVRQDYVDELAPLYPAVDVVQALRSMKGWLSADSKRLKTARGIRRFITNWLDRDQNRGGNGGGPKNGLPGLHLTQAQKQTEMFKGMAKAIKRADGEKNATDHSAGRVNSTLPAVVALSRP